MSKQFDGVAFDLDGTLYPNYRFYIRLVPFLLKEHRLVRAFGKARNILRARVRAQEIDSCADFYNIQAQSMAEILKLDQKTVHDRVEKLIYRGWEPLFKKIKLYPHVRETLAGFQDAGLKLGLLSDFPPDVKLEHLKLTGFWDTVLCSEAAGQLKPGPASFLELIKQLAVPADRLLYVGNSVSYDIIGAKKMGMKAALVRSPLLKKSPYNGNADFIFSDYRQLYDYVLRW